MASAVATHGRRLTLPRSPRLLALLSDDRLVHEVRAGNEAAFEAMYDRHHRALLSFCRHLLGSQAEAEDALQQTFTSAFVDLTSGDHEVRLKPWLFTIARNKCLSMLRRRQPEQEMDEPSVAGLDQQVGQRAELRELLGDIQRLPVNQRAALILSELRGFSHRDIAEVLDCNAEKVKSLVFQARSHLVEFREARQASCTDIRREIATPRRGAPSRLVRQHVAGCEDCAEFRRAVKRQRAGVAALLPVVPGAALKGSTLAGLGISGGAGGGGGALAAFSQLSGAKAAALAAAAVATVIAVGTGFSSHPPRAKADQAAPPVPSYPGKAVTHPLAAHSGAAAASHARRAGASHARRGSRSSAGHARRHRHHGVTSHARAPGSSGAGLQLRAPPATATTSTSAPTTAAPSAPVASPRHHGHAYAYAYGHDPKPPPPRGFTPTQGQSNGDAAQQFADGRGRKNGH